MFARSGPDVCRGSRMEPLDEDIRWLEGDYGAPVRAHAPEGAAPTQVEVDKAVHSTIAVQPLTRSLFDIRPLSASTVNISLMTIVTGLVTKDV